MYYNFCRVHQTLRVTPAMRAESATTSGQIEEMCGLLPESHTIASQIDKGLLLKALEKVAG